MHVIFSYNIMLKIITIKKIIYPYNTITFFCKKMVCWPWSVNRLSGAVCGDTVAVVDRCLISANTQAHVCSYSPTSKQTYQEEHTHTSRVHFSNLMVCLLW